MRPCLEQPLLCKVKRESDQRLHIHLNFSLFLPGIMGKKFAAQTESCIIDEKVHMNNGDVQSPRLFEDCSDQQDQC
jgi:hypothetical protein